MPLILWAGGTPELLRSKTLTKASVSMALRDGFTGCSTHSEAPKSQNR